MGWLQFEAMGLDRVKVPLAVSYVTTICFSRLHESPMTISSSNGRSKVRRIFLPAGHGICHQVHLEQFAAPERSR